TDAVSALTALIIRVTPTVFFVAKTLRSVTAILCSIAKQHCFLKLQHCFATKLVCFVAWKSFSINEFALHAPSTHCFRVKQYWFFKLQRYIGARRHCLFRKQHAFVTKTFVPSRCNPVPGPGNLAFS